MNFSNSSRSFSNASFHSLLDAAVGGAATGVGVVTDEEGLAVAGTGGVLSDLLSEGTAAGSFGAAGAVEGGGWKEKCSYNDLVISLS